MNTTTVTFKSDVRTITIDFTHNVETESLDYSVKIDPEIKEGENVDLSVILADKFLGSLMYQENIEVIPDENVENTEEV